MIINGDVLTELAKLPDESVDVVITSPPYNMRNSTGNGLMYSAGGKWPQTLLGKGYDKHTDNLPIEEYHEWMRQVISELFRVLKPTGAIFFNHKFRVQGGLMQGHPFLEGFNVRQMIIWARSGGFNFNPTYFLPTYEVIYLMPKTAKGKEAFRLKKDAKVRGQSEFPQRNMVGTTYL
jgi:modification methylase